MLNGKTMQRTWISRGVFAFAAILVSGILSNVASADIVFGTGNSNLASVNVGGWVAQDATSAKGIDLVELDEVILAMADTGLSVPAMGQAAIEATSTPFTQVMFTPIGFAWEAFELNPIYAGTAGTFKLKVIDNGGVEWISGDFSLAAGNNRVYANAINGQSIYKVTVLASGALIDEIKQVRLTQIPEPSSFALAGIGISAAAAFGLIRRRRKTPTV